MDQEPQAPQEQPSASDSGKPGLVHNFNTVIAGITGLVLALGGLAAAWDRLPFSKDEPTEQADTADTGQDKIPLAQPQAATAAEMAAPASLPERRLYTGDLFNEGKFDGGAMSLKHDGENWVLTADQAYEYEQMASPDPDRILAYNADYGSYLRWPVKGGEVEESLDKKKSWSRYARVTALNPSSE